MQQDGLQRLSKHGGSEGEHPEISQVVQDYMNVLVDWREEQVEMPKGNPWSWSYEQLQEATKDGMVKRTASWRIDEVQRVRP